MNRAESGAAVAVVSAMLLLGGCVSYDGRGLIAGQSTAAEVEASMGRPAERLAKADGGSVLYYPRGPSGRHTYAVSLAADGRLQGIDQRLTHANAMKLMVGSSTVTVNMATLLVTLPAALLTTTV